MPSEIGKRRVRIGSVLLAGVLPSGCESMALTGWLLASLPADVGGAVLRVSSSSIAKTMKQGQKSKVDGSQFNQDKGARAAAVRASSKAKRQAEREASKTAAAGRAWASVRREASAAAAWQSGQTFVAMMEAASVQARQEKHRCERLMAFAGEANKARQAAAAADLAGGVRSRVIQAAAKLGFIQGQRAAGTLSTVSTVARVTGRERRMLASAAAPSANLPRSFRPLSLHEADVQRERIAWDRLRVRAGRAARGATGAMRGNVSDTSKEEARAAALAAMVPWAGALLAGCPIPVGFPDWVAAKAARRSLRGDAACGIKAASAERDAFKREAAELIEGLAVPSEPAAAVDRPLRKALLVARAVNAAVRARCAPRIGKSKRDALWLTHAKGTGRKLRQVLVAAALGRSLSIECERVGWGFDWENGRCLMLSRAIIGYRIKQFLMRELLRELRGNGWAMALGVA